MKLLHIDSSVLGAGSASRALTANVYAPGLPSAPFEHHESYLTIVLRFIGLADITVVRAEGLGLSPAAREAAMGKAREQTAAIAA
jgi:FMN-dependent NADH-azoreductase